MGDAVRGPGAELEEGECLDEEGALVVLSRQDTRDPLTTPREREAAFQLDEKGGGVQDRPRPKNLSMAVSVVLRTGRKAGFHRGVAPTGEVSEAIWRWVTHSK